MTSVGKVTVGSTPIKLVEKNPNRLKLHIVCSSADGVLLGLDEAMESTTKCYYLPQNSALRIQYYKGEVWALRPASSDVTVYYFEE